MQARRSRCHEKGEPLRLTVIPLLTGNKYVGLMCGEATCGAGRQTGGCGRVTDRVEAFSSSLIADCYTGAIRLCQELVVWLLRAP